MIGNVYYYKNKKRKFVVIRWLDKTTLAVFDLMSQRNREIKLHDVGDLYKCWNDRREMILGHRLMKLRKQMGLTQAQMGKRLGVDRTSYCQAENGDLELKQPKLRKFCAITKFPFNRIVDMTQICELDDPEEFEEFSKQIENSKKENISLGLRREANGGFKKTK